MNSPPAFSGLQTALGPGNEALVRWVQQAAQHTQPDRIRWCDGGEAERAELEQALVRAGALRPLDPRAHPGSFLHRTEPTDAARAEDRTFLCTRSPQDAGPTNHWMSRQDAERLVWSLLRGSMRGRTMFVVPYLLGPAASPHSRVGVELTDSAYVALCLRMLTRMGAVALERLGQGGAFVRGLHSLGDLSTQRRFVVHFPESLEIWSVGSGFGGNAVLSGKSHGLRIASAQGQEEGWIAAHMALLGLTSPQGHTHYVAAALPARCGKTNLAMMVPSLPGWRVDTVGDDVAWLYPGPDGRLWAINPENGLFGATLGTNHRSNPGAMKALAQDALFTNVALRANNQPWWEGRLEKLGLEETLEDWCGEPWQPGARRPAAHPDARFAVPLRQCPGAAAGVFDDPRGVPISAIVFGGRRARVAPLVYEARTWRHGIYVGASLVSESTGDGGGPAGVPRSDPMAMRSFCGSHLGDYLDQWLNVGMNLANPPKIFHVNWFREGDDGRLLWPGFGHNVRVLKWVIERVEGRAHADKTPIGLVPTSQSIDLTGLDLSHHHLHQLLSVDGESWLEELARTQELFESLGRKLPRSLMAEHQALLQRLRSSIH